MKKFIYVLLFSIVTSAAVTSCTEEEVKPASETTSQGGVPIDPGK